MNKTIKKVLSLLMALAVEMLLVALGTHILPQDSVAASVFYWSASVLMALIFIMNLIHSLRSNKRITSDEFLKQRQTIFAASEQAKTDPSVLLQRMETALWGVRFYYMAILLLTAAIVFFSSIYTLEHTVISSVICCYILWGLFQMLLQTEAIALPEYPLSRTEYPALYKMVDEVRDISGVKMPVQLYLGGENVSIAVIRNKIVILLAVQETSVFTQQEMKQVLLHELAHVVNQDSLRLARYQKVIQRWDASNFDYITWIGTLLMTIPTTQLQNHCALYLIASSNRQEQAADELVARVGSPQQLVNALAKMAMLDFFRAEPCRELGFDYFNREAPDPQFNEYVLNLFYDRLAIREDTWRDYLHREIPARIDSHPIFRQRMESMNISTYSVNTAEPAGAYLEDVKRMRQWDDKLSFEHWSKNWDAVKSEHQIRLDHMRKYNESETPFADFSNEELYDMAAAFAEAESETSITILDHILSQEPLNSYALSMKGRLLLDREDETGAEYLFKAAEQSVNYIESYLEPVGDYALKTGNQALLERYREVGLQLTTQNMDRNNTLYKKNKSEQMIYSDLDPELFEAVRSHIIENGQDVLAEVLTAKKVVEKDYVYMYFLIFKDNISQEVKDKVYYAIFRYLDMSDEHFYLEIIDPKWKTYKQLKQWLPDCSIFNEL